MNSSDVKPRGVKVKPRKIVQLRTIAEKTREFFDLEGLYVDVVGLYEFQLEPMGVIYEYVDKSVLGDHHGLTLPNENRILIREDVYLGAVAGQGRDRFTMCHELGHLLLHDNVAFPRGEPGEHKWIEDSEWQADTFAAEFLMPVDLVRSNCRGPHDIADKFGVSTKAAINRWGKLQTQGLL